MTQAQTILTLIENVDPEDTDALDEIDARFFCYLEGKNYNLMEIIRQEIPMPYGCTQKITLLTYNDSEDYPLIEYTRSRDALKAIRQEGSNGHFCIKMRMVYGHGSVFEYQGLYGEDLDPHEFKSEPLPTEELAELWAIIQAIAYTREKTTGELDNQSE